MRKGVVCLLYGGPGTGKTETVLQIARQTGRDILQVDIAGLRTRWVGDSLKNIKSVFNTYRTICEVNEKVPILFFNEADGIFSKRSTGSHHYCDKEENAMQNIILQEMEEFEGILIATTNLACNLDKAFERRFLYKIEFTKPERNVKAKIWSSMLKKISKEDALHLATRYDFSGGQIENIARKRAIDYILTGRYPSLNEIETFCQSEILDSKKECHHIAGFAA
jgi:SpoVK/Ycf46/Vps4 family AAA+-type ATPase